MADMSKISSFKTFTQLKAEKAAIKLQEEKAAKKAELSSKLASLLDEMDITSFDELDEETKKEFIAKATSGVSEEDTKEVVEEPVEESVEPLCEATVEMDAMDPENKDFLKFLKKNRVKIINTEMSGPGGGTPVITMQGKRKDLETVLADEELGWADADLAEYIEESIVNEETLEERNAFIYAAAKAKADGKKEFEFNGKTYKVTLKADTGLKESNEVIEEESIEAINEAIIVTGKRDAKKVMNTYIKFFEKYPALGKNAMGVPDIHHSGAVKELYTEAMIDANFSREVPATKNSIKGRVFPIDVKIADLNNATIKISAGKLMDICAQNGSIISGAAKFSGLAIVEGTAMYLDSIGKTKEAEDLMAKFNQAFNEGVEVKLTEAEINERNAALDVKATEVKEDSVELIESETLDDYNKALEMSQKYAIPVATAMAMVASVGVAAAISLFKKGKRVVSKWAEKNLDESFIIEGAREEQEAMDIYAQVAGPDGSYTEPELAKADMDTFMEIVTAAGHSGSKAKKIADEFRKIATMESTVNEADVTSDEEFKEYAFSVLQKAFGEDFDEAKAQEVVDGILAKVDGDYGSAIGMLTSSLGESVEVTEAKADGTISDDEDEKRAELLKRVKEQMEELLASAELDAKDIGGSFRSPGIMNDLKKEINSQLKKFK